MVESGLLDSVIRGIPDWYRGVVTPLMSLPRPIVDPKILIVDIESTNKRILSVQIGDLIDERIYMPDTQNYRIPAELLLTYIEDFVCFNRDGSTKGAELPKNIYLITHWAVAETRHIEDFLDDFTIQSAARGLHAKGVVGKHVLHFVDSITFTSKGLSEIGKLLGIPKIEIGNRSDGEPWIEHMDEFLAAYPWDFDDYALGDCAVLGKAFRLWRGWFLDNYSIDLLACRSLSDVGAKIFRCSYLKEPLAPTRVIEHIVTKTTKKGKLVQRKSNETVFDGNREMRYFALLRDWAARNESLIYGLYDKPVAIYDIKASYGTCVRLQPLPVASTEWFYSENLQVAVANEGFVTFRFTFPADVKVPCVPVPDEKYGSLIFPTDDVGDGTIEELRLAIRMGATIHWVKAWVFTPTDAETINHPLRKYVEHFTALKQEAKTRGDVLTETIAKDLINMLIGKLIARNPIYSESEMMKLKKKVGEESFHQVWRDKKQRVQYKSTRRTGALWSPETWGLITGRGRAIISELMWLNGSFHAVTDSSTLDANTIIKLPDYLTAAGSGFETTEEDHGDGLLSMRNRLYCLMRNGLPYGKPRRAGIPCDYEDFKNKILIPNLQAGGPAVSTAEKEYIYSIKDTLEDPTCEYGRSVDKTTNISWLWDMKRRLKNWRVNPWTNYTETTPWKNVKQFVLARLIRDSELSDDEKSRRLEEIPEHPDLGKCCFELYPAPRPTVVSPERIRQVKELHAAGRSFREIATELDISYGSVANMSRS
jgi:hypothetical protein